MACATCWTRCRRTRSPLKGGDMQHHEMEMSAPRERIAAIAGALPGRRGVSIRYLDQDREGGAAADDLFPAASVIKIPIMVEAYRQAAAGLLSLDEPLPVLLEEVT